MQLKMCAAVLVVIIATSCETLAPQAAAIRVTRNAADVAQCQILGNVRSQPPFIGPSDSVNQMRNQAAGLGADVLFLTSSLPGAARNGVAYRCAATTVK